MRRWERQEPTGQFLKVRGGYYPVKCCLWQGRWWLVAGSVMCPAEQGVRGLEYQMHAAEEKEELDQRMSR